MLRGRCDDVGVQTENAVDDGSAPFIRTATMGLMTGTRCYFAAREAGTFGNALALLLLTVVLTWSSS